jgi:hypothetical protein
VSQRPYARLSVALNFSIILTGIDRPGIRPQMEAVVAISIGGALVLAALAWMVLR